MAGRESTIAGDNPVMDHLIAVTVLLAVAAITPGPNNLVVLRTAGRCGLRGALPAIGGIVAGGLLVLALAMLGAGTLFAAYPSSQRWIGIAGALYLAWLGGLLFVGGLRPAPVDGQPATRALPSGVLGLIGFQFLNPKSWVMVLTALATVHAIEPHGDLALVLLFVLIPTPCLLLWASLGAVLARWLARPNVRRSVDAGMGALLLASAGLLLHP
jgi:threonine/homoserine/homoserine lactone efflux protein